MKRLRIIDFDPVQCRKELDRFQALLGSKRELSEQRDLRPLFEDSPQLAAFVGTCFPNIGPANRLAFEFQIFGDFVADLVVGNADRTTYCAIELEDARPNSIFGKRARRSTSEWGTRLEHGFGQLVDWFFALDDHRNSAGFVRHFGYGHVKFYGMLLIGRTADLSDFDRTRLRWRSDRVTVNTHEVFCLTYDELLEALNNEWQVRTLMSRR